jgi:hypothetical protein
MTTPHITQLKKFDQQRKKWLMLSALIFIAVLATIFDWQHIQYYKLEWTLASLGFILSVFWWYWTMRVIRYLINHKIKEHEILNDIVLDIRSIKQEIVNQKD